MNKESDIVPKLIDFDDLNLTLILENIGEQLSLKNMPDDYIYQAVCIMSVLKNTSINHNDLWYGNILVKDGKIRIIDFEKASHTDEIPQFYHNDNLLDIPAIF